MRKLALFTLFSFMLTGMIVITGCGEDEPTDPNEPGKAKVLFLHGAEGATGTVDFVIGSTVVSTNRDVGATTSYFDVEEGSTNYIVRTNGTANALIDTAIRVEGDQNYTLVALNETGGPVELRLFRDDLTTQAGKAMVRVIYLINDGPQVKVAFRGEGIQLYTKKSPLSFGNSEAFNAYEPGAHTLRVMDKDVQGPNDMQGETTKIIEEDINLIAGKVYTFAVVGTMANPSLVTIEHN